MKILIISGDHPRHIYFHKKIIEQKNIDVKSIILKRESFSKPKIFSKNKKHIFLLKKHFEDRDKEEKIFFSDNIKLKNFFSVDKSNFNSKILNHLKKNRNYKVVIIFGTHMINKELRKYMPKNTINLHLGLSPNYRGTATLFWPFYFLEPQFAGFTFHKLGDAPDTGEILHQGSPNLERGDKIHTVACKTVVKATKDISILLKNFKLKKWKYARQKTSGKNFQTKDFHPCHLDVIYNKFNNRIVDMYLDKKLSIKKPKLINFFKK